MGKLRDNWCPISGSFCKNGKISLAPKEVYWGMTETESTGTPVDPPDPNAKDPYRVKCVFWDAMSDRCKLWTVTP